MKKLIALLLLAGICISANAESFDRGIYNAHTVFIPKGSVGAGIALTYRDFKVGNNMPDGFSFLSSLVNNVHGGLNTFGVSPFVSFFVADNVSVGLLFDYSSTKLGVNSADITLGDALSFSLKDKNYHKQSDNGAITLRDYIPFALSKRFAMFAELRVGGGYAQTKDYKQESAELFGTYQDIYNFYMQLVPGLTCFVSNEVAIEVSVGVLGYDYSKTVQKTNQVKVSEMVSNQANCRIDLLSINLGMSFYLPVVKY